MMRRWAWLLPLMAIAALFAVRIAGPADLLDKDQPRPVEYVVDAVADRNWIIQRDAGGAVASKPPLYTWMAGAATLLTGGGSRTALYLPCAAAVAALALMAFAVGWRRLGFAAGMCAATILALTSDAQKQVALARTDAVFSACVAATAFLALRAWESGRGWMWFWVAGAVATLAKTPLGLVFAAGGLVAAWWGRHDATPRIRQQASGHAWGVLLFLAIAGGWFLAAIATLGQPVIDKMIGRELVQHAVANDKGDPLWSTFPLPAWWYLTRFLPWSVPLVWAVWTVWRSPPASPRQRRLLRFCVCWLAAGLAVLTLSPHKRIDLAVPLLLPGALLSGWAVARWIGRWGDRRVVLASAFALVLGIGAVAVYQHVHRADEPRVVESEHLMSAIGRIERLRLAGATVGLHRVPALSRYFIGGWPAPLDGEAARRLLAGAAPAAVVARVSAGLPGFQAVDGGFVVVMNQAAAALDR